jgi:hypothetical protein
MRPPSATCAPPAAPKLVATQPQQLDEVCRQVKGIGAVLVRCEVEEGAMTPPRSATRSSPEGGRRESRSATVRTASRVFGLRRSYDDDLLQRNPNHAARPVQAQLGLLEPLHKLS